MINPFILLSIAIATEVVATTALKASDGFTRLIPSAGVVIGYCISFYFLSLVLRSIPTGIAYALWAGVGIVLISLMAWIFHNQTLDLYAIFGMAMIIAGVAVINIFSKTASH
jgi:small multidrug resistance pump